MKKCGYSTAAVLVALFAGLASTPLLASGLQVAPMMLTITAPKTAAALWLSNTGKNELHAQVRAYQWTQSGFDGKKLAQSQNLVVSPPIVDLAPGKKQLVRVIHVGPLPVGETAYEQSYRLIVNELPPPKDEEHPGLNFILRYSLPVFIVPASHGKLLTPALHWQMKLGGTQPILAGTNNGDKHARLTDAFFVTRNGEQIELHKGLFGYVLPHETRKWKLHPATKLPTEGGGSIMVKINGEARTLPVEVVHAQG